MAGVMSVEISFPPGPRRSAARKPVSPVPAASSRMAWPGPGAIWSTSHSDVRRCRSSCLSRLRSHAPATAS